MPVHRKPPMQAMWRRILPAVLCVWLVGPASMLADEPAEEAAPTAEADAPEDAPDPNRDPEINSDVLQVLPGSINRSSSINFDEEGFVNNEGHNLSVNLNCFYDPTLRPLSYELLGIDNVVTSSGEQLRPEVHPYRQVIHPQQHNQPRPRFNIGFALPEPSMRCESIQRLSGRVRFFVGVEPIRHAVIGPLNKIEGRRVRIGNYPDARLVVRREQGRIRIDFTGESWRKLDQVRFFGGHNREFPVGGWSGGGDGRSFTRTYHVPLTDDGKIVVSLWSDVKEIEAPFVVTDIPMPGTPADEAEVDLVIEARPIDDIRALFDIEGDLEVIVGEEEPAPEG